MISWRYDNMKVKKLIAGIIAITIAASTFIGVSISADAANNFVLMGNVAEQVCERDDIPTLKNGVSESISLKSGEKIYNFNSNRILSGGWYYKLPVSSNGKAVIDISANGGSCKNVFFINCDEKNYVYKMLESSNDFFTTQTGESCYGSILYGNKDTFPQEGQHKNDEKLIYCASLQCENYVGSFSFDVKKGNYILAIYQDNDNEKCKVTITASYPSSNDTRITDISELTIGKIPTQTYTGKAIKPSITIKDGNKKLVSGTDYTVTYKNNTKPGKATATITGKGNYTGTKTLTFKIVPKKVTLTGKTSGTKEALSWKKSTGAAGYEIYYSADGGKFRKLTTVKGTKYSAEMTAAGTYKFKVRPYVRINGKKVYGQWSNTVSCK